MDIRKELKEYIKNDIFEIYKLNEQGHGIDHIKYVIRRSLEFAKTIDDINYEMVYVVAAYHDIAHYIDKEKHEIISAKILSEDKKLKEFFTNIQIEIMKEAVEDHRSSLKNEPRSIYGKIVSSADRNTKVEATLKRCYSYNRRHLTSLAEEEIIEECRLFLLKKFGINGYAREKMYFEDMQYEKYLDDMANLALDKERFCTEIKRINNIGVINNY